MTSWQPLPGFLERDLSKAAAKEMSDLASPMLVEIVNYATNAFRRCETSASGSPNEDLSVLSLYRHIIEMTDGVEVLVSNACPRPALPLVRSSFEALLSIQYILEADYSTRSLCWLAGYVQQRIEMYERLDPSSNRGKAFAKAIRSDPYTQAMATPNSPNIDKSIQNLQGLLQSPQMQPIEAEHARLKKTIRRRPEWYRLFGGPPDLRALACHLNHEAWYDSLYRIWSQVAHGNDFSTFLRKGDRGEALLIPLRDLNTIQDTIAEVTAFAAAFMLEATRRMLAQFRPGEEENFAQWYRCQVWNRFVLVSEHKRSRRPATTR